MQSIDRQWVGRDANRAVLFAMPMLAAAFGSAASILLFACLVWNAAGLAMGRIRLPGDRLLLAATAILLAYFGLRFVSVFAGQSPDFNTLQAFKHLAFFAFLPVVAALLHAPVDDPLAVYLRGAATGAILGAAEGLAQIYLLGFARAEGLSGNSGPYATIMVLSGGLSAGLAALPSRRDKWLGLAGLAGGLAGVLLAGSKGMLPAMLAVSVMAFAFLKRRGAVQADRRMIAFGAAALVLMIAISLPVLNWRLTQLKDDIANIEKGRLVRSIGARLVMWEEGLAAFRLKPLFGHGYNMRSEVVREAVTRRTGAPPGTHLHNSYITDLTGNGLAGLFTHIAVLAAPFLLLGGARRHPDAGLARFAAAIAVSTYVVADLSALTFGHDILDAWFVFFLCLLASLVPAGNPPEIVNAAKA